MVTLRCKLLAKEKDFAGYITYVFQNLEINPTFGHKYIMMTRWPNWQHRNIEIDEIGYVTYKEVQAGIDTWYDGTKFVSYNYTNIVFIKFVKEKPDNSKEIVL